MYIHHTVRTPGKKEARRHVKTPDFWEPEQTRVPASAGQTPQSHTSTVRQARRKKKGSSHDDE